MNGNFMQALLEACVTACATQSLLIEKGIVSKAEVEAREQEMRDKLKQCFIDEMFGSDYGAKEQK